MLAKRAGVIIAIGSVNGLSALGDPAYSAAKAAMISLTRSLAQEYGRFGIRANIVLPGTVRTPLWQRRAAKNPEVLETLRRWYPLGRIVEPMDVALAVGFLASDAASAITGVGLAGRLRIDVRQHRHDPRADARRFLIGPDAAVALCPASIDAASRCLDDRGSDQSSSSSWRATTRQQLPGRTLPGCRRP